MDIHFNQYFYRYETDDGPKTLKSSIDLYKQGYIQENDAHFFSGLRPVSADDIPMIGKWPLIKYVLECIRSKKKITWHFGQ